MANTTDEVRFEARHPQLYLANGQTIPAITVPIIIAAGFAVWKLVQRRWAQRVSAEDTNPDEKLPTVEVKQEKSEAESSAPKSKVVDEENQQSPPPAEITRLQKFIWVLCYYCGMNSFYFSMKPWMPFWIFSGLIACHLLTTATIYYGAGLSKAKLNAKAIAAAALLALAFTCLNAMPPWPLPLLAVLGIVSLLSWWPLAEGSNRWDETVRFHSTSLMTLLIRMHVPESMWAREVENPALAPRWVTAMCMSPLLLLVLWKAICRWTGLEVWSTRGISRAGNIAVDLCLGLIIILYTATIFILAFIALGIVQFATTCVGFNWLINRQPAAQLSFTRTNLGGVISMFLYSVLSFRRRSKSMRDLFQVIVDAAGWTITGLISLGLVLLLVERVLG